MRSAEQVTEKDQNNINMFSRLNTRKHELQATIKDKQSYVEELEDASNELILADDDEDLRLLVGESLSSGQTLGVKAQRFRGHTSPHRNVKEKK
eukprot:TRINITY_DN3804_c0_g1_i1.p2 TRINITY_DN3804_c0_g1~~TRINITY_DN3804_c0_g1_i1.p2  ORF type:complete len:109 (-),score=27.25 TRINITY_DN3804_c0_g1_i1:21-302(-)